MCHCADSKEFERQLQASLVTSMILGDSYPLANQPGNGEFTIPKSYGCLCQVGFLSMSSFLTGRNCLGSPLDTHMCIHIVTFILYIYICMIIYTYRYVFENEWQELLTCAVWAIAEIGPFVPSIAPPTHRVKPRCFPLFFLRQEPFLALHFW